MKKNKIDLSKYASRKREFFNIYRKLFQLFVTHIFYMIRFKFVYKMKVEGKENIPKDNAYIVAPNHLSTLDPAAAASVLDRPVAYMSKKELFNNIFMRILLDFLGGFAVDREKVSMATIKTVMTIKKTDWVLGIFPQGTREEPGKITKITKGFAHLAQKTKCGVLPVAIIGTHEAKRIPFSGQMIIKIGKLISYENDIEDIINQWGKQIEEMTDFKYEPEEE